MPTMNQDNRADVLFLLPQAVEHTLRLNRAAAAIKLVQTKALEPGTGAVWGLAFGSAVECQQ